MPRKLEARLKREAKKKRFGKARTNRYVYGTLHKLGYRTGRKRKRR